MTDVQFRFQAHDCSAWFRDLNTGEVFAVNILQPPETWRLPAHSLLLLRIGSKASAKLRHLDRDLKVAIRISFTQSLCPMSSFVTLAKDQNKLSTYVFGYIEYFIKMHDFILIL